MHIPCKKRSSITTKLSTMYHPFPKFIYTKYMIKVPKQIILCCHYILECYVSQPAGLFSYRYAGYKSLRAVLCNPQCMHGCQTVTVAVLPKKTREEGQELCTACKQCVPACKAALYNQAVWDCNQTWMIPCIRNHVSDVHYYMYVYAIKH